MTAHDAAPPGGALGAVQRLESALEERTDPGAAEAGLGAARAAARRLLSGARRDGEKAGQRRRADILAEAEAEARAIRADGVAHVQEVHERVAERQDELIAELSALVLPEEAASACSSR